MITQVERILILAKTYPSPSSQYVETSCVAGINEQGLMRRIYPVPFRLIEEGQQFKKWQWIEAKVRKASKDHRPESHRIFVDTISCQEGIDTKRGWESRWKWIERIPMFESISAIDAARIHDGSSLALLRPAKILGLEVKKARYPDWTADELDKLKKDQMQGSLFSEMEAAQQVKSLEKIPFDFYYNVSCDAAEGPEVRRLKIVDWEAAMLYRNCRRSHGNNWEAPFRAKLEENLAGKDLMLLLGNQHRFQDQWLVISLIYPPKRKQVEDLQPSLF